MEQGVPPPLESPEEPFMSLDPTEITVGRIDTLETEQDAPRERSLTLAN